MAMKRSKGFLSCLIPLFLCFGAAGAWAQNVEPRPGDKVEVYTVRPKDTLIGLTVRYLGDPSLWQENLRLNPQVRDPRRLQPGSKIRLIVARAVPKAEAVVSRVANHVDQKPYPNPWVPAQLGNQLKEQDGMRTFNRSSAEMRFDDGSQVVMTENSLMFLRQMEKPARGPAQDEVEIIDGQIDLRNGERTQKPANINVLVGSVTISHRVTPRAPVAARSRRTADSRAQVMVYGGSTTVASAGKSVGVAAGMGTSVEQGKPPAPPQKLLPAPLLSVPPAGRTAREAGVSWSPVPGAASYTVEVFRDAGATQLVDRATGIAGTSWQPSTALPGDQLFWRATAVSPAGLDGFPAAVARIPPAGGLRGTVAEDFATRGTIDTKTPLAGVRLVVYRDDGDDRPGSGDARAAEGRTDATGAFAFDLPSGTYWLAVDSRSITPSRGLNDGWAATSTWAEQTYGSAGTLCAADGGAISVRENDGPCVGGRLLTVSDDASSLATSKHVGRSVVGESSSGPLIFGFSFDVVDRLDDTPRADRERSSQGSLRQFITNANAIRGGNALRFVPAVAATDRSASVAAPSRKAPAPKEMTFSAPRDWWTIRCGAPLPPIEDDETWLLGTASVLTDPSRRVHPSETAQSAPDLEVELPDTGLTISRSTRIEGVAINAPKLAVRASAPLTASAVGIGVHPDGSPAGEGDGGIDLEGGVSHLSDVVIAGRREVSLHAAESAMLFATGLQVTSAAAATGPAVVIDSQLASLGKSQVDGGGSGRGIDLGRSSGGAKITDTGIAHCSDGIVIEGGSSQNQLRQIRFADISGTAVLFKPEPGAVPAGNRISQCDFTSVGALVAPVSEKPGECTREDDAPNRGVAPPAVTSFERVPRSLLALYGRGCVGTTVEIYEGTVGPRIDAHFVHASAPAYDGTFGLLVEHYDASTRMFLTTTDGEGNTSPFTVSPPPKLSDK